MKFFEAAIDTIIIRYYLMMAAVIIPFVIGVPVLAIVAVPIFLSALMGIKFERSVNVTEVVKNTAKTTVSKAMVTNRKKVA